MTGSFIIINIVFRQIKPIAASQTHGASETEDLNSSEGISEPDPCDQHVMFGLHHSFCQKAYWMHIYGYHYTPARIRCVPLEGERLKDRF
jgi:hypothetical protein